MTKVSTKQVTLCGVLAALVAVGTMVISVPVPMTNGYINLGDGFILTIAYLFGGPYAALAGAVGSSAADILLGYPHWAVFTFIIKGAMGYGAGKICKRDKGVFSLTSFGAATLAETIMVGGYFLAECLLYSSVAVAASSVPANVIQAIGAFVVFFVLAGILRNNIAR